MTNAIDERSRKFMAVMDYGDVNWQSEAMHQNSLLHDALTRAEVAEAKLAKATDALKELIFLSDEGDIVDWLNALSRAQELMAEIKGE
jgi:hypothetical protein